MENSATVDELEWLRTYEATRGAPGRPRKDGSDGEEETETAEATDVESSQPGDAEGDDDDAAQDDGDGAAAAAADPAAAHVPPAASDPVAGRPLPPPPRPPRIKLAPPPRTRASAADDEPKAGGKDDWRAKYKKGFGGSGGRETTVTEIAKIWTGTLESLCDGMRAAGIEPKIDPQTMYPSIVLVVDDLLPPHVELTPQMIAVGGTTVLVVQRFMNRKEIADVEKRKKDGDAMRARTDERKQRATDADVSASTAPADAADAPPGEPTAPPLRIVPDDRSGFAEPSPPVNGFPRVSSADLLASDPTAVL